MGINCEQAQSLFLVDFNLFTGYNGHYLYMIRCLFWNTGCYFYKSSKYLTSLYASKVQKGEQKISAGISKEGTYLNIYYQITDFEDGGGGGGGVNLSGTD